MMAGGEEMDKLTAELEEFERSDREAAERTDGGGSHLANAFREESEELHREEAQREEARPEEGRETR